MVITIAGCGDVVAGKPVAGKTRPPVTVASLGDYLLPMLELNQAMGVVGMEQDGAIRTVLTTAEPTVDKACLGVANSTYEQAYTGSGWTAARVRIAHQPGDYPDWAREAVVLFPSRAEANAFYDASAKGWAACPRHFASFRFTDGAPSAWTLGDVSNTAGTLSVNMTQEAGNGWACQRALTVANNIVVDVNICTYRPLGRLAIDMAREIRSRIDPI